MNRDQESAWLEAQGIDISEDLVAAARRQLAFLAAVDRLRRLYDGPLLDRAICRYGHPWWNLACDRVYTVTSDVEDCRLPFLKGCLDLMRD